MKKIIKLVRVEKELHEQIKFVSAYCKQSIYQFVNEELRKTLMNPRFEKAIAFYTEEKIDPSENITPNQH